MLHFTSHREKRLWIYALTAVVAVYATLGVAQALAAELRDRGLLGVVFGTGLALIVLSIVTQGLRARPRGIEIGVALGIAGVYLIAG